MARARVIAIVGALLLTACSSGARDGGAPPPTLPSTGPLSPALLTQSQLRRVPGLATAIVVALPTVDVFDDPDPRGPCGGKVPHVALSDAIGAAWNANTIRTGAQLVVRRPAAELQRYMRARIRDAKPECPSFETKNRQGQTQQVKFDAAVRVTREADQSFAVVMAIKIGASVRAATTIEVRIGNVLSRAVVFTDRPMATPTVRGIASLMAKSAATVD